MNCGVDVRHFAPDVVGTVAAAMPHIDWMQHLMGLAPGDEALVPEIADNWSETSFCRSMACTCQPPDTLLQQGKNRPSSDMAGLQ